LLKNSAFQTSSQKTMDGTIMKVEDGFSTNTHLQSLHSNRYCPSSIISIVFDLLCFPHRGHWIL